MASPINPNPDNITNPIQTHPPNPNPPRVINDNLSSLTKSLTRQFRGIASFLAPPPQLSGQNSNANESDADESEVVGISGFKSDLTEIGGRFKSGISSISGKVKLGEISKRASDFIKKAVEDLNEEAARNVVGVSDEVVDFAEDIASHPDTWLDFPLPDQDIDEGFEMSDAQQEHALAVERLAPRLAALRMELCPEYISESCFWKIYFVLLHPKLDKEDAVLLSTPQVMEARALLSTELQKHPKAKQDVKPSITSVDEKASTEAPDDHPENHPTSIDIQVVRESATSSSSADFQTDKNPIAPPEIHIVDKSVIKVEHNDQVKDKNVQSGPANAWKNKEDEEDDTDDWLKEETSELGGRATENTIHIENDEDISFSDLEDDDEDASSTLKKVNNNSNKDS